jgi:hypothetical protein
MALPGSAHATAGIVDEEKLGVIDYDVPIGGDHKEYCVNVKGEVLFVSPEFLRSIWATRPSFGVTINARTSRHSPITFPAPASRPRPPACPTSASVSAAASRPGCTAAGGWHLLSAVTCERSLWPR